MSSAVFRGNPTLSSRWISQSNDYRVRLLQNTGVSKVARSFSSSSKKVEGAALKSSSGKKSTPKTTESAIVAAVPAWHTKILDKAKSDPGNLVMNAGAIISLSGFMMSDVMYLRGLSIVGSMCGMSFNLTRKPPQYNAVMWGLVFVSVNVYHLYHLYLERTDDMTFHQDEMMLYTSHFKDWGVEPWQFKKLVKLDGCRFCTFKRGDIIVSADKPLSDVMMVVKGEVGVEDKNDPPLSKTPKYTYRGDGKNGCVIGGTALVDPLVRTKDYPNRLVAQTDDTVVVKWDTDKLSNVMQTDKDIESAVLHALYVELIQGLRRDRKNKKNSDKFDKMSDTLLELESMISKAAEGALKESGDGSIKLKPDDKKAIRLYAASNEITTSQRENVLYKLGWTLDEWDDGAKSAVAN